MIITLIVLLLGLGCAYGGWWLASGRFSHVPKVTGKTFNAAKQELEHAGFKVATRPAPQYSENR